MKPDAAPLPIGNIALYRRVGYVETERVREKGFDRVYMENRRMQKIDVTRVDA